VDNHFKIIVPFYNVEEWIRAGIRSVKKQTYSNFECVLANDASTDKSFEIAKEEIKLDSRFKLINSVEKTCTLVNTCKAVDSSSPKSEDIIVMLDGDDWLASGDVLTILNEIYNREKCWMTYGSYVEYPSGFRGKFAKRLPPSVVENNSFRENPWSTGHLRTFKYKLWQNIDLEDFKDSSGQYYTMTGDLAAMFPMLEMAAERSYFIDDVLYVYNNQNPLNDHKIDNRRQIMIEHEIRNKKKYSRLGDTKC